MEMQYIGQLELTKLHDVTLTESGIAVNLGLKFVRQTTLPLICSQALSGGCTEHYFDQSIFLMSTEFHQN